MAEKQDEMDAIIRFMRGDKSMLKCTVCGAGFGACDCWQPCGCGWSFRKGETCKNPEHGKGKGHA